MDRRRFLRTLLGAGAALYVPARTFFFLGEPERRVLRPRVEDYGKIVVTSYPMLAPETVRICSRELHRFAMTSWPLDPSTIIAGGGPVRFV